MPVGSNRTAANLQSLDWLFGQLPGKMRGNVIPPEIYDGTGLPVELGAHSHGDQGPAPPQPPPPALDNPESLQAAYEWFKTERAKLEEFTRFQFAAVRQHQQADLARHYRSEENLALRAQELNREMQFLATQSKALQARARELAMWESRLSTQAQKLTQAHDDLLNIHKTSTNVRKDTQAQLASLQQMRDEMAQLQSAEVAARASFAAFEAELTERQRTWEKKQADLAARQTEMEQRYEALEQAEIAAARRLAELDDLEDRLREEFEAQQRQLVKDRQEVEALYTQMRGRGDLPCGKTPEPTAARFDAALHADLEALQTEIEQRFEALKQAEEAQRRRMARLDGLVGRLQAEFDG
jgi:DNA repair exonuclease SbcCD ATPase subunit